MLTLIMQGPQAANLVTGGFDHLRVAFHEALGRGERPQHKVTTLNLSRTSPIKDYFITINQVVVAHEWKRVSA